MGSARLIPWSGTDFGGGQSRIPFVARAFQRQSLLSVAVIANAATEFVRHNVNRCICNHHTVRLLLIGIEVGGGAVENPRFYERSKQPKNESGSDLTRSLPLKFRC